MKFERSEEYIAKLALEAFDRDVRLDARIEIICLGSKLKAYCVDTGTYAQFPRNLRSFGGVFVADVIKSAKADGVPFYRAVKGSIRPVMGKVIGQPVA